jgi:hypothetical protein
MEKDPKTTEYTEEKIKAMKAKTEKARIETDERMKNSIKWGDKENPLTAGDYAVGVVESIETGKSDNTADMVFIGINGKCLMYGLVRVGHVVALANSILKKEIEKGTIAIGKEVFIEYLGTKQPKDPKKQPYRLFDVSLV